MKQSEGKNWYTGDKIKDLVDNVEADKQVKIDGATQEDSNYIDEMYSDDQLKRHEDMDNIFKVDNIPSRWEHNKTRSTYHFDPLVPDTEPCWVVPCRFVGNFQPAIDHALKEAKEHTIGNYRARNMSKQDQDLHDGEILDVVRASGKEDMSCMYYDRVTGSKFNKDTGRNEVKENRIPEYEVLFNMIDALDMEVHQSRLHIQRLGQVTPFHIDQQMRYARKGWRERYTEIGADKNPLIIRRFLIMLQDWDYGHIWQFGNSMYTGYKAGEAVTYDWCNMPHGTANCGYTPRVTFQLTGFISEKTQWLIDNPDSERIIEV
jgi:hypothetical protein